MDQKQIDVRVSLDNGQASDLRTALAKPSPSFWTSDALLRTIQVIAIVVGGCWVLIQFVLFERDRIQLENSRIVAETAANESQARLQGVEEKQRSLELTAAQTYGFELKRDANVVESRRIDDKSALYVIRYSAEITNKSAATFEMSLWVLDYYTGALRSDLQKATSFVEPIGFPADRWNSGSATGGAVVWERVGSVGAIFPNAQGGIASPWDYAVEDVALRSGGGMTGKLKPNQSLHVVDDFLVKASPGTYVAFVHSMCFNRCKDSDNDLFKSRIYVALPEQPDSTHGRKRL